MEKAKPITVTTSGNFVILTVTDQTFGHTLQATLTPENARYYATLLLQAAGSK